MMKHANWIYPSEDIGEVCPIFRKTFSAEEKTEALLTITALGVYEAYLNGNPIGDFYLAPGWTSYSNRLQVQEYDLTPLLRQENELTVTLGKGWFAGRISLDTYKSLASGPRLIAELHLTAADGTVCVVGTDESWQWAESPIRFSDLYDGEIYDARITPQNWRFCQTDACGKQMLISQEGEAITAHERFAPIETLHTPKGETVLDFGQEISGYVEFSVQARCGERIELSCAEVLDADGNFYNENYRSAKARMEYICKEGSQTGRAHHTFYGFRYLRVDCAPEGWKPENFTAVSIYSDLRRTGYITTSEPLLNRLYENIIWSEKDNLVDVPTDCPQRDERLGWTGDAQVSIGAILYSFDAKRFYTKWLRDLAMEQRADGAVSHFVPRVDYPFVKDPSMFCSGAAWADAAVICPWQLYQAYGDKTLLREHLPMMQKWVEYVRKEAGENHIWSTGHQYGDWLALDAGAGDYTGASRKDLIATAFYAHAVSIVAQALETLGRDSTDYQELFRAIRSAHRWAFPEYRTQTEYALALYFGLAAEPEKAAAQLAAMVQKNGSRLTTGFVGTPYLLHALSENGYAQTAYSLLLQTRYPSWLFSVLQGATTVWEHWDSRREDGSFWSTDMNSFNHHAYGAVADWMYSVAGGIRPGKPGYETLTLAPAADRRIHAFKTELQTPRGRVLSGWEWDAESIQYSFLTPVEAEIRLHDTCWHVKAGAYRFLCRPNGEVVRQEQ